jgi:hypothetical protein
LNKKEGLQPAIYFKKRHGESGHSFLNIQASLALSLVAAGLKGLRNDTIYHYGFDTVKLDRFQIQPKTK